MKNLAALLFIVILAIVGVLMASDVDKRSSNMDCPIFRYSAELICPRDGTYAIQSKDIYVNGVVGQICVRSTGDINNPNIIVTINDDLDNILYTSESLDTNTPYVFGIDDFNNFLVAGMVTVNVNFSEGSLDANYPMIVNVDLYGK